MSDWSENRDPRTATVLFYLEFKQMIEPLRTEPLSQRELYLFDTMGVLKIPGFLNPETLPRFREAILSGPSRVMPGRGDKVRYDDLTAHSPTLDAFAHHRALRGCVGPLINQPLRLIESYALLRQGNSVFYLHNGQSEHVVYAGGQQAQRNMSVAHTYHDGKLYCQFVKCLVYLTDVVTDEDGAFCYLQGSHKANYSWFSVPIEQSDKPALTQENFPSLASMQVRAGDLLLLNEALLHGTLPKRTDGDRLVAAFSYAPCYISDWKAVDIESSDLHRVGHF